mmetsp:Transcript_1150/g.3369  ORF Transcript_1150/g.3369 Transcript_1150/m.3369 type:complete len:226 (+) Transcript_1150:491-1168(+)
MPVYASSSLATPWRARMRSAISTLTKPVWWVARRQPISRSSADIRWFATGASKRASKTGQCAISAIARRIGTGRWRSGESAPRRRCPPISSATHWLDETCVAERSAASSGTGMVVGKDVERLVQRRHLDGGLASVGRSRARAPFSGRRVARRGREVAGSKCGVTAAARRRLGSVSLGPGGPTPALSHAEFGPARRSGAQQRRRMHSTPAVSRRRLGASDGRLDVS